MGKVALITGVTGQDGAYLAELLLAKGYASTASSAASSSFNTGRIEHLYQDPHERDPRFVLHYGDMTDATNLIRIVQEMQPDEIYNLAAQSHVQVSFETPEYTANADALGTLRLLEAIRILGLGARRALLPGLDLGALRPGAGGAAARDDAVLSAQPLCGGQALRLLDHGELPRGLRHARLERHPVQPREPDPRRDLRHPQDHPRGGRDQLGLQECLYLGNLDAQRDWGHARDYVEGMWLMLQQDEPDDYVLATGETAHGAQLRRDGPSPRSAATIDWRGEGRRRGRALTRDSGRVPRRGRPALFPADRGRPAASAIRARRSEKLGWRHRDRARRARAARWSPPTSRCWRASTTSSRAMADCPMRYCPSRASASASPAIAAWSARRSSAGSRARIARS